MELYEDNLPILGISDVTTGMTCYRYQLTGIKDRIITMEKHKGNLLYAYGQVIGIYDSIDSVPEIQQGMKYCIYNNGEDTPEYKTDYLYESGFTKKFVYAEYGTIIKDRYVVSLQTYLNEQLVVFDIDAVIDENSPVSVISLRNQKCLLDDKHIKVLHEHAINEGFDIAYRYGFYSPVSYLNISNIPLRMSNIIVSYTKNDYPVIGHDILSMFDYHFGKSKVTGTNIFLGCPKNMLNDEYFMALHEHFGIGLNSPYFKSKLKFNISLLRN